MVWFLVRSPKMDSNSMAATLTTYKPIQTGDTKLLLQIQTEAGSGHFLSCSECGETRKEELCVIRNGQDILCQSCVRSLGLHRYLPPPRTTRIIDRITDLNQIEKLSEADLSSLILSRRELSVATDFARSCHYQARQVIARRQQRLYRQNPPPPPPKRVKKVAKKKKKKNSRRQALIAKANLRKQAKRRLRAEEERLLEFLYRDFDNRNIKLPEKGWRKIMLNRVRSLGIEWDSPGLESVVRRLRRRGIDPPLSSILEYALSMLARPDVLRITVDDVCQDISERFGISVNSCYVSWILKTESDRNPKLCREYDHSRSDFVLFFVD